MASTVTEFQWPKMSHAEMSAQGRQLRGTNASVRCPDLRPLRGRFSDAVRIAEVRSQNVELGLAARVQRVEGPVFITQAINSDSRHSRNARSFTEDVAADDALHGVLGGAGQRPSREDHRLVDEHPLLTVGVAGPRLYDSRLDSSLTHRVILQR
jgi:hypothetical protein